MVVNLRVLRRTWLKVLSFEKMFLRAYLMYFSGDQLSVHIHNKFGDAQVSFFDVSFSVAEAVPRKE